jgi:hypothetical protein
MKREELKIGQLIKFSEPFAAGDKTLFIVLTLPDDSGHFRQACIYQKGKLYREFTGDYVTKLYCYEIAVDVP